jgi:hypothetical protein
MISPRGTIAKKIKENVKLPENQVIFGIARSTLQCADIRQMILVTDQIKFIIT